MSAPGQVIQDATVVIDEGRIASIRSHAPATTDRSIRKIDGRGKWLMPALADMHVHVENDRLLRLHLQDPTIPNGTVRTADALLPYVANGVLQIAVLSAMPETRRQREEVEGGRVLGPHMALAAMIDGSPPILPIGITQVAATPAEGRQRVREAAAEGYDIIKVYSRLDVETFLAILDEAHKAGMRVVGHIPQRQQNTIEKFLVPGFDMVAHAEEFALQTDPPAMASIPHYAELAKRSGTWLATTLTANERFLEQTENPASLRRRPEVRYVQPALQTYTFDHNPYTQQASPVRIEFLRRIVEFNRVLVRTFAERRVPLVAGTDALLPGVVPGFSLHDELQSLAHAGLSNYAVLEAATRRPAEWLGTSHDRGTIVVGKRADLLLLDANPLENIVNTRRIVAVIVSGEYHSRADLEQRMQDLLERNALLPPGG